MQWHGCTNMKVHRSSFFQLITFFCWYCQVDNQCSLLKSIYWEKHLLNRDHGKRHFTAIWWMPVPSNFPSDKKLFWFNLRFWDFECIRRTFYDLSLCMGSPRFFSKNNRGSWYNDDTVPPLRCTTIIFLDTINFNVIL